jgi:hypothetical protein
VRNIILKKNTKLINFFFIAEFVEFIDEVEKYMVVAMEIVAIAAHSFAIILQLNLLWRKSNYVPILKGFSVERILKTHELGGLPPLCMHDVV